jgi:hypothetical protein
MMLKFLNLFSAFPIFFRFVIINWPLASHPQILLSLDLICLFPPVFSQA